MFFKDWLAGTRRQVTWLLTLGGLCVAVLAGIAVWPALFGDGLAAVIVVAGCGLAALFFAFELLRLHFRRLERLRGAVIVAMSQNASEIIYAGSGSTHDDAARLHLVMNALVKDRLAIRRELNQRLEAVLATVADAVLVVTDSGLVSLVNSGAKSLLGQKEVAVGTSVFAALHRTGWERAAEQASQAAGSVEVELETLAGKRFKARVSELADHGGFTLVFRPDAEIKAQVLEHDLDLHDAPPDAAALQGTTELSNLPAVVFDCETTGLDVEREVILSIGAVRLHGSRIYRSSVIDQIVDPRRPIPKASTAIHGITDDMVKQAENFGQVWPQLRAMLENAVLVGHNIAFDAAFLEKAARALGDNWPVPVFLDTVLLYAALYPQAERLALDEVAAQLGVSIEGRHTALGDALATAEVFTTMLPPLHEAGVKTIDQALEFQARAKQVIARQEKAGWPVPPNAVPH
jgi:DNA polymerase-3 subunit epsilon